MKRAVQIIRSIIGFKKRRKPRTDFTGGWTVDRLVDCTCVVNWRQNDFCVILNVPGVRDVRQDEVTHVGCCCLLGWMAVEEFNLLAPELFF